MPDMALSDLKVLDFTQAIAGPYCTKLLADFGADVIKVERPDGGDPSRRWGPFPNDDPHPEKSGLFLLLNTNKRSITLNLKTEAGKKIARQLVEWADIVVESFRPGTMAKFGLDYPTLHALKPTLVYTSISNFGQTGPYRDYLASEIIIYGMGGELYSTGLDFREPVKMYGTVCQFLAGNIAAVATMGAVFVARLQSIGQQVDISLMETQLGNQDRRMPALVAYQYTGEVSGRIPLGQAGYPIGIYPCKDGYFEIMSGLGRFRQAAEMLGNPDWLQDPKWYTPTAQQDPALKEEFEAHFFPWLMEHTMAELWEIAQRHRVLSAPVNTVADVVNDPVFNERGAFIEVEHPVAGKVKMPSRPFLMSETPWQLRRPAPLLGQHNEEVLCGLLGYSKEDLVKLREQNVI
ncbi:Succinyl-CoA:(R)-benzylsuccinate CoA-transferase subunit BbsE [bacterium HR23]|nr:Succinyl-CoA:(R)-benzylsuccinate CoA-transferase subunit BbsE [bacterium HR23]